MRLLHRFYACGRGDNIHSLYFFYAALFEQIYCGDKTSARCKHGVYDDYRLVLYAVGQLAVVFPRFERVVVAVHSYVSHLCRGQKSVYAVDHAEPSAQHGHDDDGVFNDHLLGAPFKRSGNLHKLCGHVLQRFKRHERGYFLNQLAELLCSCFHASQKSDFVTD